MNKYKKLIISGLSILFIVLMINPLSLNETSALLEDSSSEVSIEIIDKSSWNWTNTEVVSTVSTGSFERSAIAVDDFGNVHTVWDDNTDYAGAGSDIDILYRKWNVTDGVWLTTEVISTVSNSDSRKPSIVVNDDGDIFIAWQDLENYLSSGSDWDILFRIWNASTATWSTTELVSTETTSFDCSDPHLAVDKDNNIHIVWLDRSDYDSAGADVDVFYKFRNSTTETWTNTEVVSSGLFGSLTNGGVSMDIDGSGNIHVTWYQDYSSQGFKIYYKYKDAETSNWSAYEQVSNLTSSNAAYYPSLSADKDGNVHVSWMETTSNSVLYRFRDSITESWENIDTVSTQDTISSSYPKIKVDIAGAVHIAWTDSNDYASSGTDKDIFYRYKDADSSWSSVSVASIYSSADSDRVSLAVDSFGHTHLVWNDLTNYGGSGTDIDLFYSKYVGPPTTTPVLDSISPNPTTDNSIYLNWSEEVFDATHYLVYRSNSYISSLSGLSYLISRTDTQYVDTLPSQGFYYYVIVAMNDFGSSGSFSNCENVYYNFPDTSLETPILAPILPNPSNDPSIFLDWNDIVNITEYYIYRSNSFIWSFDSLTPLATVIDSDYTDSLPSEDYYFYVVVASNGVTNSTPSNCEYIKYELPDPSPLQAPDLAIVIPNPSDISNIFLDWDDIDGAVGYYIYRANSYIWSVDSLTPLTTVVDSDYIDSLPFEDYYFYVIVATDGLTNSTLSNCEYVEYRLPTLFEYLFPIGLTISLACIVTFAIFLRRKRPSI